MRKIVNIALVLLGLTAKASAQAQSTLRDQFTHIPDSIQTSVYWYWINGNISKEGVIKDLEAMHKVGINRAFIGNIGLDGDSRVKIFSD
jgi:hypothetical protein